MRQKVLLIITFISIVTAMQATEIDTTFFQKEEYHLIELNREIALSSGREKSEKEAEFLKSLQKMLAHPGSEDYIFDTVKFIGRISTKDNSVIVYTWNIPLQGGFNNYYCIIQYYSKKQKVYLLKALTEKIGFINQSPQMKASANYWPGALYYDIVPNKYKGEYYYTLLGFEFNNMVSNRKIIEVFKIENDEIVFLKDNFVYDGKLQTRIIFEYAERAQMLLKYSEKEKIIYFDHLSPFKPSLEGKFQFYGPDLSYDAFIFEDGIWQHQKDITPDF